MAEKKASPSLDYEIRLGFPRRWIAGTDEVGRGCIAGPVVAAAVILPSEINFSKDSWLLQVNDSKCLTHTLREELAPKIQTWAKSSAVAFATVSEIDQINIFHASHLAMVRAIRALSIEPEHILVDGKFLPQKGLVIPATAVIQGDQKCLSIAAASILAKVWRDQLMANLDLEYPGYGFAKHKGYPTPGHAQALQKKGICLMHRRSFKTVSALV